MYCSDQTVDSLCGLLSILLISQGDMGLHKDLNRAIALGPTAVLLSYGIVLRGTGLYAPNCLTPSGVRRRDGPDVIR